MAELLNINDGSKGIGQGKRDAILALDVGDVRIGVAVSSGYLATPIQIIKRDDLAVERIQKLVAEYNVGLILIGLPMNMDGSIGFQAKKTMRFADKIREAVPGVEIALEDERQSTEMARELRLERGTKKKQRRTHIDAEAAALFLQAYLDRGGNHG